MFLVKIESKETSLRVNFAVVQQDGDLKLKLVSVISLVYCIFIFISFNSRINGNKMAEKSSWKMMKHSFYSLS